MDTINSWNGFDPLKEVWLGDVYPEHFYDDLEPGTRDTFYTITKWTREDLDVIEAFLVNHGVTVRRPFYSDNPDAYKNNGVLLKPSICPRDNFLVYGNKLFVPWREGNSPIDPWSRTLEHYKTLGAELRMNSTPFNISSASAVRLGVDFYLDCVYTNQYHGWSTTDSRKSFETHIPPLFPNSRCHYLDNGGHVDSCFAVLRPGLILVTEYFDSYDRLFPGWTQIVVNSPEFFNHNQSHRNPAFAQNLRWHVPGTNLPGCFNEYVTAYARDWVGNYQETYFEVNCLVIDHANVMMSGKNAQIREALEQQGMAVHEMPFRCRTFWDGGLHCITLDIRRTGSKIDYFPDLG